MKVLKTFIILLSIFSLMSFVIYFKDKSTLENENRLKAHAASIDLSTFLIDGHKLGENISKIDKRIFMIYCENGRYFTSYFNGKENFEGCITSKIIAFISKEGTEISYNGQDLASYKDIIEKLGDKYLKGLPISGSDNTVTYIDKKNNTELSFANDDQIVMKRIEDNTGRIAATPTITFFKNPIYLVYSFFGVLKSMYLFNRSDYVALPLYFTLFLLPFILLFMVNNTEKRKLLQIICISLVIISLLMYFMDMWEAMRGV